MNRNASPLKRPRAAASHSRGRKLLLLTAGLLVLLLIAGRLYLPYWLKEYVNNVLQNIEGYSGSVQDIDVHLFRGAYVINALNLTKNGANAPVPFLHIDTTDLSIQWGALFHGRIVSDVHLRGAELNFIINDGHAVQTGQEVDWTKPIKDLMPIDINLVEINGGKISYRDYSASPDVNLYIDHLHGEIANLRNVVDENEALPSHIRFQGDSIGGGKLRIEGDVNALRPTPDMDLDLKLENADLTAINDLAIEHAGLDFARGNLSIYSEFIVKEGEVHGYIKPVARDIQVTDLRQDTNPLEYLWESLASIVIELLENQPKDQFATKVPLEGRLDSIDTDNWEAFVAILRNAFVQAFTRDTDDSVDFNDPQTEEKKDAPKAEPIPLGIRRH